MKIVLEKGQQLFFTSDTHYAHSNICSATTKWEGSSNLTRQFNSLDHMNNTLVNNINCMVGEDDILIHLGDFSFGGFEKIQEFRDRIVCKNIHLVRTKPCLVWLFSTQSTCQIEQGLCYRLPFQNDY